MKILIVSLASLVVVVHPARTDVTDGSKPEISAERLATLRDNFEELRRDIGKDQRAFDTRYEAELEALKETAQAQGDLDLVLRVREEMEAFRERDSNVIPSPNQKLDRLRSIYSEQTKIIQDRQREKLEGLISGYLKALTDFRHDATKAGEIDVAVKVQEEIRRIESEVPAPQPESIEPADDAAPTLESPDAKPKRLRQLETIEDYQRWLMKSRWRAADGSGLMFADDGAGFWIVGSVPFPESFPGTYKLSLLEEGILKFTWSNGEIGNVRISDDLRTINRGGKLFERVDE